MAAPNNTGSNDVSPSTTSHPQLTPDEVQEFRSVMGEMSAIVQALRSGAVLTSLPTQEPIPVVPPAAPVHNVPFVHVVPPVQDHHDIEINPHHDEARSQHEQEDWLNLKLKSFETSLKAIQGFEGLKSTSYEDLCIFPNVVFPPKFKVPEFEKYDGTGDPYSHLKLYVGKLGPYGQEMYLRMHLFQHSLTGIALRWFLDQDVNIYKTWEDLANSFLKQFKHNLDLLPDRFSLDRIRKKQTESFREYASRWLRTASQVKPPLEEKERVSTFIRAQEGIYYDKIMSMAGRSFADVILQGEMVEDGLRNGKLVDMTAIKAVSEAIQSGANKKPFSKKKEEEVSMVAHQPFPYVNASSYPPPYYFHSRPTSSYAYSNPSSSQSPPPRPNHVSYPPASVYQAQYQNPQPRRERPPLSPNSMTIPNQQAPAYNYQRQMERRDRKFTDLGCPLSQVYEQLRGAEKISPIIARPPPNPLPRNFNHQATCAYHSNAAGHSIDQCYSLRHKIQDMIDAGDIVIQATDVPNVHQNPLPAHNVNMITLDDENANPIQYIVAKSDEEKRDDAVKLPSGLTTLEIKKPCPFVIKVTQRSPILFIHKTPQVIMSDTHNAPWNYEKTKLILGENPSSVAEVGHMTRSGRIYAPPDSNKGPLDRQGVVVSKPVSDDEAVEFLKLIKKSEYKVVDTLSKMPAQISMLGLLLSSEPHRKVLLQVLNEAHIPGTISTDKFADVVGYVLASNQISFSDDEFIPEGRGHNKPLHIAISAYDMIVGRVLLDNGSALNICPLATLTRLGIEPGKVRPNGAIVRAFDGAKRETLGEIDLVVLIGPGSFSITFQVLDIPTTYNMLLGRPWIHTAGAVPSSLHQKVKFIHKDSLVTVDAEEDHAIYKTPDQHILGVTESLGYKEYQVINASYVGEGSCQFKPMLPRASLMMAKQLKRHGYEHGKGLGRELQGIREPVKAKGNAFHFGVGYKPGKQDYRHTERMNLAREGIYIPMEIPPLTITFPKAKEVIGDDKLSAALTEGPINTLEFEELNLDDLFVDMVGGEGTSEPPILVARPSNWSSFPLPIKKNFV